MKSAKGSKTIAREGYIVLNGKIVYVQIDYNHLFKSFMRAIIGGNADANANLQ
jgi:hypothetical protein